MDAAKLKSQSILIADLTKKELRFKGNNSVETPKLGVSTTLQKKSVPFEVNGLRYFGIF
jgi:hypothetical protein